MGKSISKNILFEWANDFLSSHSNPFKPFNDDDWKALKEHSGNCEICKDVRWHLLETFEKILKIKQLKNWLATEGVERTQRMKSLLLSTEIPLRDEVAANFGEEGNNNDDKYETQRIELIKSAISKHRHHKEIIELLQKGKSYKEISQIRGISESRVRGILLEIRNKWKEIEK